MDIKVPTQEEFRKAQKKKRKNLGCGIFFGLFIFSGIGYKVFIYGFDSVEWYTWLVLFLGVISFGVMAYKFEDAFWSLFKR